MSVSEGHSETNFRSNVLTIFGSQLAVKLLGLVSAKIIGILSEFQKSLHG